MSISFWLSETKLYTYHVQTSPATEQDYDDWDPSSQPNIIITYDGEAFYKETLTPIDSSEAQKLKLKGEKIRTYNNNLFDNSLNINFSNDNARIILGLLGLSSEVGNISISGMLKKINIAEKNVATGHFTERTSVDTGTDWSGRKGNGPRMIDPGLNRQDILTRLDMLTNLCRRGIEIMKESMAEGTPNKVTIEWG